MTDSELDELDPELLETVDELPADSIRDDAVTRIAPQRLVAPHHEEPARPSLEAFAPAAALPVAVPPPAAPAPLAPVTAHVKVATPGWVVAVLAVEGLLIVGAVAALAWLARR